MKKITAAFLILVLLTVASYSALFTLATAEETQSTESTETSEASEATDTSVPEAATYTITYDKGLNIVYAPTGQTPDNFIKGNPPEAQTVTEGGSVTVAANTFTFREYVFTGWSYTYTDENNKSVTKVYKPGDTISNVSSNMLLKAKWGRTDLDLSVSCFVTFDKGNSSETHKTGYYLNQVITLPTAADLSDEIQFIGWRDNDGLVYSAGDNYTLKYLTQRFKAVWSNDFIPKTNYNVSISYTNGGIVTPDTSFELEKGESVTLEFIPDTNFKVKDVVIDGVSFGELQDYSIEAIDKNYTVHVVFTELMDDSEDNGETFRFEVITYGSGNVSPDLNGVAIDAGDGVEFEFEAHSGWRFAGYVYVNGERLDLEDSGMVLYADRNYTIEVYFTQINGDEEIIIIGGDDNNGGGFTLKKSAIFVVTGLAVAVAVAFFVIMTQTNKKKKKKK